MMQKYITITIFFLLAVALIFFGSTLWLGKDKIITPLENVSLLANIDLDGDGYFSLHHIINGREAVLVVRTQNIHFQKLLKKLSLKDFRLEYLDENDDGAISPDDPMFWSLLIMSYDSDTKKFVIRPMFGTAIWAILLKRENIRKEHRAVLTDSTHRLTKETFKE